MAVAACFAGPAILRGQSHQQAERGCLLLGRVLVEQPLGGDDDSARRIEQKAGIGTKLVLRGSRIRPVRPAVTAAVDHLETPSVLQLAADGRAVDVLESPACDG